MTLKTIAAVTVLGLGCAVATAACSSPNRAFDQSRGDGGLGGDTGTDSGGSLAQAAGSQNTAGMAGGVSGAESGGVGGAGMGGMAISGTLTGGGGTGGAAGGGGEVPVALDCAPGVKRSCSEFGLLGSCGLGTQQCSTAGKWDACSVTAKEKDSCVTGNDDSCDGVPNKDCGCVNGAERACAGAQGNCAAGKQKCADGNWGACSIAAAAADSCVPGDDANCNGQPNEKCTCKDGETQPCGPEAVGICKRGTSACSGGVWGACAGVVGPQLRDCTSSADNDCNGEADNKTDGVCQCGTGQTQSCNPHVGLDGKGICKAGSQTCSMAANKTSSSWGSCSGSIGPSARDCTSAADNDCNGSADNIVDAACTCVPDATQTCGAHPGFDGKGICKAGSQTCNASGSKTTSAWGGCSGSVAPAARNCASSADNDCNGIADNTIDATCVCTPQAKRCMTGTAQICGSNGKWGNDETCQNVCRGNTCGSDPKTVFVTSTTYLGELDGMGTHDTTGPARADALCQAHADNANLNGTYKAWLSDSATAPFLTFSKAGGPFQLPSGELVANNWADFTSGSLRHAINETEWKDAPTNAGGCADGVWTNTTVEGYAYTTTDDQDWCGHWTYGYSALHARVGSFSRKDGAWSSGCTAVCNAPYPLYCIQQ